MISQLFALLRAGVSSLCDKRELALENLALRQQLQVYNRNAKRPKLTDVDRVFWMALMRWWPKWREALIIVKPETVISWYDISQIQCHGRDANLDLLAFNPRIARPFDA